MDEHKLYVGVPLVINEARSVTPTKEEFIEGQPKADLDEVDQNHIKNSSDNQPDGGPRSNQSDPAEDEMDSDEDEINTNPEMDDHNLYVGVPLVINEAKSVTPTKEEFIEGQPKADLDEVDQNHIKNSSDNQPDGGPRSNQSDPAEDEMDSDVDDLNPSPEMYDQNFYVGVPLVINEARSVTPTKEEFIEGQPKADLDEVDQNHIKNSSDNQPDGGPRSNQSDPAEDEMDSDEDEINTNPEIYNYNLYVGVPLVIDEARCVTPTKEEFIKPKADLDEVDQNHIKNSSDNQPDGVPRSHESDPAEDEMNSDEDDLNPSPEPDGGSRSNECDPAEDEMDSEEDDLNPSPDPDGGPRSYESDPAEDEMNSDEDDLNPSPEPDGGPRSYESDPAEDEMNSDEDDHNPSPENNDNIDVEAYDNDDDSWVSLPTDDWENESIESQEIEADPNEVDHDQNDTENSSDNQSDGGPRPNQPDPAGVEMDGDYDDDDDSQQSEITESETEEIIDIASSIYSAIRTARPRRRLTRCLHAGLTAYFAKFQYILEHDAPAVPPPSPNIDEHINEPGPEMPDVPEGNQRVRHNRQERREIGPYFRRRVGRRYNAILGGYVHVPNSPNREDDFD